MTVETACALCCAVSCSISAACAVWAVSSASKARTARRVAELLLEAARRRAGRGGRPALVPPDAPATEAPPLSVFGPFEAADPDPVILPFPGR